MTSDGSTSYVYDAENRLVTATGATSASLAYDPNGRLFETAGGSAGTTRFLYDGDALVAEYDGSNALLRRYVHGAGVDEPLLWLEGADIANVRWLHADHQGSIIAASDASNNTIAIDSYDEYGIPGTQNQGRFQYTGQIWLPELGLYHYKARLYSPTLGRFLQTDPIGYKDQINLYAYVGDDPVNKSDPSGLAGCGSLTKYDSASCSGETTLGNAVVKEVREERPALDLVNPNTAQASQDENGVYSLSDGEVSRVGWQNPAEHAGVKQVQAEECMLRLQMDLVICMDILTQEAH